MELYPFYYVMKALFNFSLRSYYRKIQFKNAKSLHTRRPVLLAMNHPNSFMDSMLFGATAKPKMFALARGDSFKKGISFLLDAVGIIPIYRLMDSGREGMKKNDETFRVVKNHLKKNHTIMIFAEGLCIQERRLRSLKKGCARMAFDALDLENSDQLVVIPVGLNYQSNPSKFRHRVFFNIGQPIRISDYREEYLKTPTRAINHLTENIHTKMKETIVHINDPANDELIEHLEEIFIDEFLEENNIDKEDLSERHEQTLKIVAAVNKFSESDPKKIESIKERSKKYFQNLRSLGLRDKLFHERKSGWSTSPSLLFRTLLFVIGIPFWIAGLITNYPPYFLAGLCGRKLVKNVEWYASVAMLIGTFAFFFYYVAQFLTVWFVFHDWKIFFAFFPMPFLLGWFCLHYSPFRKKLFGSWKFFRLKKNKPEYEKLKSERAEILGELKTMLPN